MVATTPFNELTVPALFVPIGNGLAPESLGDRAIRQTVAAAEMADTMEPEESLIADVRGNWTPHEMVERKLMALSYTCRPGYFSRTHDGGEARPRRPVSEQQASEPVSIVIVRFVGPQTDRALYRERGVGEAQEGMNE